MENLGREVEPEMKKAGNFEPSGDVAYRLSRTVVNTYS